MFGKPFDETKYNRVIQACMLTNDIGRFPNGDLVFVGEHGVVLSGGQKARVNLARAVYANADLYLLDDPLSAVDSKVGDHIFFECICNLLKNKTRVLVTYTERYLRMVDQVVVLNNGSVSGKGTYSELKERGVIIDSIIDASSAMVPLSCKCSIHISEVTRCLIYHDPFYFHHLIILPTCSMKDFPSIST